MEENKKLCERYIKILKKHRLTDIDELNEIIQGKKLDLELLNKLSKYYDKIDNKDEDNSLKPLINKYNLDKLSNDWDEESKNIDWNSLWEKEFSRLGVNNEYKRNS